MSDPDRLPIPDPAAQKADRDDTSIDPDMEQSPAHREEQRLEPDADSDPA
ncbi:hypothetical protein DEU35_2783 [Microbacterium sp. AG157]|uniref:Uncharacterized protein n=1 Tax=Microbacterium testaceum TaxID=2033 RepID=A0A4Y3QP85_MICTE|nr:MULTISPECIES: hypothetical protein [Microbacterium]REC97026.1 hypothetical protein DEU35_2783 [Microbacterium sp. AG157]WJS92526.1 hypothetical protein NYQ11_08285 [Microbacterium testaceum]GEB46597.1 hypothetical protein MTE01_25420 [Microbacterium testaceum]